MKTAVYIDVLFTINFIINFLLLLATSRIAKIQSHILRIIMGASCGAVYAVFMFFPQVKIFYTVASKIAVSFILVAITFSIKKFRHFLKTVCIFYATSFIFGGVCLGIFYFTGAGRGSIISNGIFYFNLPWRILIFSSFFAYVIIRVLWKIRKSDRLREFKQIDVFLNGKNVSLIALVDTGNMLKDPLTQTPVVVADFNRIQSIFSEDFRRVYTKMHDCPENIILNNEGGDMISRLRIIPFSSLGATQGLLLGFKPDFVEIDKRVAENIIIGISNSALSRNKDYDALINPEILTAL